MKSTEIKEKMNKAIEKLEKMETLKVKKEKKVQKAMVNPADEWEYDEAVETLENTIKNIEKQKKTVESWKEKYQLALTKEAATEEFPEALKAMQTYVAEETFKGWKELAKEVREANLGYWEEIEKFGQFGADLATMMDEDIQKEANKKAEAQVRNLYQRIIEMTGKEIKAWNIHFYAGQINGQVEGKEGKAEVTTIEAGGWAIQRFHYRTLVKKVA